MFILLVSEENSYTQAWINLASHWDSEWYEAIAKYGYINIDGPATTGLTNANVVFFPGYPYLARVFITLFNLSPKVSLLLVSQTFALFFWILFFHITRNNKLIVQIYAAGLIMLFPTSWFLFTGYAESMFLFATCLMLNFSIEKKWLLATISAYLMTATRIIGIPVLIVPFIATIIFNYAEIRQHLRDNRIVSILKNIYKPCVLGIIGCLGCLSFFIYCQINFDSWHLYFDMEKIGWKGEADPFFIFKLPTWMPPPIGFNVDYAPPLPVSYVKIFVFDFFRLAAYTFSETLVPIFLWICILFSFFIFKKKQELEKYSFSFYLAAILIFVFNCLSLYTRHYESMSRCLYPVWVLLIISDVTHPSKVLLFKLGKRKLAITVGLIMLISGGFWLQLLNRFLLSWWVA
ncbi:MAG: hypothetical protein P1U74_05970 [Legionellaceae bacterium]|nr:hypothetical protein [Legionellaceae bacterium]